MRMTPRRLISILTLATLPVLAGCRAPIADDIFENDQVFDGNVSATRSKDLHLEAGVLPPIDELMTLGVGGLAALAPNPAQEGCAIGLVQGGEVTYLRGYGMADTNLGEQWDVGTMSAVGSIAKTWTALAVMKLVEEGLVALNGTVDDYLTVDNSDIAGLRVRDLLNHSSGVGGATQGAAFGPNWNAGDINDCVGMGAVPPCPFFSWHLTHPRTAFAFYEDTETVATIWQPGFLANAVYSNVGYSILGAIVDQVTTSSAAIPHAERGYEAYIWHNLGRWAKNDFTAGQMISLALSHSWRLTDIPNYARGNDVQNGFRHDVWENTEGLEGWEGPAGGWMMTIGDLSRLILALQENNLVSAASFDQMSTATSNFLGGYGYGVFVDEDDDYRMLWHGGDVAGYAAIWTSWPDLQKEAGIDPFGVALMCNHNTVNAVGLKDYADYVFEEIYLPANGIFPEGGVLEQTNAAEVDDAIFEINLDAATVGSPKNLYLPLVSSYDLLLHVADNRDRTLKLTLLEATLEKGKITPSGRPATLLGSAVPYTSGRTFETTPTDLSIASPFGDLELAGASFEIGFTKGGSGLTQVALRARLDAAQLYYLGATSTASEICAAVREGGGDCVDCVDGKATCFDVVFTHIEGSRIGGGSTGNQNATKTPSTRK